MDDILDNPTAWRYDALTPDGKEVRDTVKVSQGKVYVAVSGSAQHIVTVMIP